MPIPAVIAAANKARKAVDAATGGKATAGGKKAVRWVVGGTAGLVVLLTLSVGGPLPSEAGTCGPGALVPSSADLSAPVLAGINALKPDYEAAAAATGLSFAALAALDFREDGNDPSRSALSGELLGTTNPDSGVVTTTKADSLQRAGEHLKTMASSVYGVTLTATTGGEDMQKAFLAYNRGSAYARTSPPTPPTASPYVMNNFGPPEYANMTFPNIPGETLAGMQDTRFGAMTVFSRLGGSSGCGLSSTQIVALAQQEIGNHEDPDGANRGPTVDKYLGSSLTALSDDQRAWCAMFLSWLHREAGIPFTGGQDGGWNLWGVSDVVGWTRAHGTWVDRDPANPPQPGDSISFGGGAHIGIVEKVEGSTITAISGNYSNGVGRSTNSTSDPYVDGWGR